MEGGKRLAKPDHSNKKELAPLIAVFAILLGLSVASFALPDQAFSANENRYLQQAPKLTWQRLMGGDFTADAEDYTSDQIALRDFWMQSKSVLQEASGKKDIGGTYLCKDGYYMARVTEDDFDRRQFEKNAEIVSAFFDANAHKDCRIMLIPQSATVLTEKLPNGAETFDRAACDEYLSRIFMGNAIMPYGTMSAAADTREVYYRTDHHWTSFGAQAVYGLWARATGHEVRDFSLTEVTDSFRGTMYSKVLLPRSAYDSIYLDESVTIESMDCDGTVYPSLYVDAALQQKDKYEVFMGGNYAKVTIDTGVKNGKSLLLIKDSYANSFIPFIVGDYETVTVLDLRYFRGSVQELADECTDILVLYEMTGFAADHNQIKLMK